MNPISLVTPRTDVSSEPTTARPTPRSGVAFKDVVARSASSLVAEAQSMVTRLPGGPVLAAAVRGGTPTSAVVHPAVGTPGSNLQPITASGLPTPPSGAAAGTGTSAAPAEGPGGGGDSATSSIDSTMQSSQDMNLYYLQLQEAMAAENRSFTTCSNVLKSRHDTVKNAIGNIRLSGPDWRERGDPMSIDGIGKKAGVPGTGAPAVAPASGAKSTFEIDKAGAAGASGEVSPADRVRSGALDIHGYLDLRVEEATRHLEGKLAPADMARVKEHLRTQLAEDPTLADMVKSATGVAPPPAEEG